MLRERNEILFKTYEEPELDDEGNLKNKKKKLNLMQQNNDLDTSAIRNDSMRDFGDIDVSLMEDQEMIDDLRKEMDLPEGALVTNLFIPVSVVCSKVDLIQNGEPHIKQLLETNLDFIQYSLRKFCLSYGASLIFASAMQSGNAHSNVTTLRGQQESAGQHIKLIYDYFLYRIYDEEFIHPSNTKDKEALFIPAGFDSLDLINGFYKTTLASDRYRNADGEESEFNEAIKRPDKAMMNG